MENKYRILTSKKVDKFLEKHRFIARKFVLLLENISLDPHSNSLDIKKLKGKENSYRLRIGKYRFLYEIIENEIVIYFYDAGNRGNIYK